MAGALLIYLFESKARLNWNDEREAFVTPYIFVTFLRFSPRFSQDPLRLAEIVPLKDVYPDLASEHWHLYSDQSLRHSFGIRFDLYFIFPGIPSHHPPSQSMELISQFQPLDIVDFHHHPFLGTTEEEIYYVPGGFHPIIICDVLSPSPENESRQYRKLGFGSHSTVWLAQKTDSSPAFVALKITMAKDGMAREATTLEAASKVQTTHLITLLDHFTLHGPNGTHTVLVMDIVVPMRSLIRTQRRLVWDKAAAHGLTQAVADLHSAGIVHGGVYGSTISIEESC